MAVSPSTSMPPYIERQTFCIAGPTQGVATHAGEEEFAKRLRHNFESEDSNINERLIHFKDELNRLDTEAFWSELMTGMTQICHAQFGFVSKRVLIDDERSAVEMPRIGETGSCLMGTALYYNNGKGIKGMHRDYKYHAWVCPCSHMKHDKVFLVPEGLPEFIGPDNPNQMAFECEAYFGVPIFADGKCIAHFGMLWTKEGLEKKRFLSWALIEMFMHSLEDLITRKLLAGQTFARPPEPKPVEEAKIIPSHAITATQSLKVYARSLSHELRTPMQGVVGMLDLMYATVQEQIEGVNSNTLRQIFRSLKENIEVVQDSSKRAIEAADNVVHAYDLNMQVPQTPSEELATPSEHNNTSYFPAKTDMSNGSQIVKPLKRKRSPSTEGSCCTTKCRRIEEVMYDEEMASRPVSRGTTNTDSVSPRRKSPPQTMYDGQPNTIAMPQPIYPTALEIDTGISTPGFRQSNIRDVLPVVINDSLRTGGRPDFAVSSPTAYGETIEVKSRSSNGESSSKLVTWTVNPEVPDYAPIDERDLSKLIGAVFLNSLKFTDQGTIDILVQLSASKRFILIKITDTGSGIPETFQPELFKPFSKEDGSTTRTKEGLGLGLMVAKGLARKLGGDITLLRTSTQGPAQGTEFEIRIPKEPGDTTSRATTPFRALEDHNAPRSVPPTTPTFTRPLTTSPLMRELSPLDSTSPTTTVPLARPFEPDVKMETPTHVPVRPSNNMHRRMSSTPKVSPKLDRQLAQKYPLTFLVAEDNKINRKLLVQMLNKLGYKDVHEAYDGKEAIRLMKKLVNDRKSRKRRNSNMHTQAAVDVILMDLWMPEVDGYQATEQILSMFEPEVTPMDVVHRPVSASGLPPTVLAVSADVTDTAIARATKIGMAGYMTKPYKVLDLQKLILEFCVPRTHGSALPVTEA